VTFDNDGRLTNVRPRLVVCADGRSSMARKWGGFTVRRDLDGMLISGVLFDAMPAVAPDVNHWIMNPSAAKFAFLTPQMGGRVRAYAWHPKEVDYRLQGEADLPRFIEDSAEAGAPDEWYAGARALGSLASFDGTDSWVEHPYRDGVALIGDAAASNDPSYGQGQSLTARDVRVLRDHLLRCDDWDAAGHRYAEEHDRYYDALHRCTDWIRQIFYSTGSEAEVLRARVFPLLAQDMTRMPDAVMSGPEVPLDETVRRRFFGDE
jgi:2-polyprenyl-6-methoxyphenol hydroxylase-like FAD-dependent oxidoreductase